MPKAMRVHHTGSADVLQWEEVAMPAPAKGELLLRHTAVGLNYIDVYHRTGLYPVAGGLPFTPGMEAAGIVEAVGEGVEAFKPGDRVVYCKGPLGAYSEYRVIAQEHVLRLPDYISDAHAAASLLKGQTAHMLLRRTYSVMPGTTILVRAAAGGVGLFLCQWARALGATVIGTVGSEEKAKFAADNGCQYPIIYTSENTVERVQQITGGTGCNVVYDSVGKDTFMESLDCLVPFGLMVSFGQSSGAIPPFDVKLLMDKGSLFLTRPTLLHYKRQYEEYFTGAAELFDLMKAGTIKAHVGQSYYLSDAATAHRDLEAKHTHGSTLLLPG